MQSILWGVVPVAGRGTRMLPLSRAIPKELLPLGRKPVLHHVVEELVLAGLRDLVFVVSPGKPVVREYMSDKQFWRQQLEPLTAEDVRMHFVEQVRPLGLGDAIRQALPLLGRHSFVVALGDCVFDAAGGAGVTQRMIAASAKGLTGAVIALEEVPLKDVSKYGIARPETAGDSFRIIDLVEKPLPETAPSRWAIAGRYIFDPSIFVELLKTAPGRGGEVQLTDAIGGLIREGRPVIGMPLQPGERRLDVGEFSSYFQAFEEFARADAIRAAPKVGQEIRATGSSPEKRSAVGRAYARAGLLGNPSDGYGGKVISCILGNWQAEVRIASADTLTFLPGTGELTQFDSVDEFLIAVRRHGYYGGLRLVQAATKRFFEYCLPQLTASQMSQNFSAEYCSNIPRQLGLGGSSAIVTATLRALAAFYRVDLPIEWLPSLALSVETSELGIPAGLQDRVIQAYEGLVYMDFAPDKSVCERGLTRGSYERLNHELLPKLYVAIRETAAEPTEVLHNDLRRRFERGEPEVLAAMRRFAELAAQGRQAILDRDSERLSELMNANFDLRRSICQILPEHLQMIDVARSAGASAKFCGSGGAIVGVYKDEAALDRLRVALAKIGAQVFQPKIGIWH